MNPEEAKFILSSARPGGVDAADPQVREALALLENNPALAAWYEREQAIDRALSRKLREGLPCPAELKARLLAARRTVKPLVWWRQPAWLAAAACLLALALVGGVWAAVEWPRHYRDFESDMLARTASATNQTVYLAADFSTAASLLAAHGANTNFVLPPGLTGLPLEGSYAFRWNLHRVTALRVKLPGGKPADLYVLENPRFSDILHNCEPELSPAGGSSTAHYYGHLNEYYLLLAPPEAGLEKLFQAKTP